MAAPERWPTDAASGAHEAALIGRLTASLADALTPKLDGTRHHRRCLNRTMNASPTTCSARCVAAHRLLDAADDGPRRSEAS
jgi:hypothetical protein